MASTRSNQSSIESRTPLAPDLDPSRVKEMKAQGRKVLQLDHVSWGEDLGPLLKKKGLLSESKTSTPTPPRATSDLASPEPVEKT
jgi:hypothetical protein